MVIMPLMVLFQMTRTMQWMGQAQGHGVPLTETTRMMRSVTSWICSHNLNINMHPCIKSSAKFAESTFYLQGFFEASLSLITTCSS